MTRDLLTEFLSKHPMSASLTPSEVDTLMQYLEVVETHHKEIIADIGEVGEGLFFVVSGTAALYDDDGSQEIEVGRMETGELAGEMSFFDRVPRGVRMRALTDNTRLLRLTRSKYDRLRVEHPYIAVNVLEFAIISLDHLIRRVSEDVATYARYLYAPGKK
ncbi:Crp/Fnr family transcriptional regulator [Thioalkalivibrio sp. ALJ24]|uniref:Crp/Fnr family transcriptional regulator n=1 Tax=Thioalkalivibrio sp. ALJ24 TaxID=545276 RepID=UPI00037BD488|nr:cyclic nucleotide-binding domain-containing protein [Thioalkalivibrio sp. ALJ24]